MDRMRSRKPSLRSQPSLVSKATHEDFKPNMDWIDDDNQSNRTLLIQLPGFKREEIRVQLDNAGKLFIKGSKQVSDDKYLDVYQVIDVPEDTIADKINGTFEDGRLTLIMPKKEVIAEEHLKERKDEEKSKDAEEKQNELTQKEKPKSIEEENKEEAAAKHEHVEEKTISREENKAEHTKEEKEEGQNELTQKEKPKSIEEENKEEEAKHEHVEEKTTSREENKDEHTKEENEEEQYGQAQKEKSMKSIERKQSVEDRTIKMKKKMSEMRKKISNIWFDSVSIHGMLEKLNRNRKVIAVGVLAFSAGFYACKKLTAC